MKKMLIAAMLLAMNFGVKAQVQTLTVVNNTCVTITLVGAIANTVGACTSGPWAINGTVINSGGGSVTLTSASAGWLPNPPNPTPPTNWEFEFLTWTADDGGHGTANCSGGGVDGCGKVTSFSPPVCSSSCATYTATWTTTSATTATVAFN